MNYPLGQPNLPSPQGENWLPWARNLVMQLNGFFPRLAAQWDFQTLPRDAKVSSPTVGSLTAADPLNLTSSIQVVRSAGSTQDIATINPPVGATTPSGIVVLILTHQTHDYTFKDGTGNLVLGADKTIGSGDASQARILIYDRYRWYPLKGSW